MVVTRFSPILYFCDVKEEEAGIVAGQVAVPFAGPGHGLSSKHLLVC